MKIVKRWVTCQHVPEGLEAPENERVYHTKTFTVSKPPARLSDERLRRRAWHQQCVERLCLVAQNLERTQERTQEEKA